MTIQITVDDLDKNVFLVARALSANKKIFSEMQLCQTIMSVVKELSLEITQLSNVRC